MKYVVVKADTNDADYVEETTILDQYTKYYDFDLVEALKRISSAISNNPDGHNWTTGEMYDEESMSYYQEVLSKEDLNFFEQIIPSGEYGIHSIESIRLLEVTSDERIL